MDGLFIVRPARALTGKTSTGFHCLAYFNRKHYQTKRKATSEEKANVNLHPHKLYPEWNYTIQPNLNDQLIFGQRLRVDVDEFLNTDFTE
jgi:hypothetical protein